MANVSLMQKPYYMSTCEKCKNGRMEVPKPYQEWHLVCSNCDSILFCYTPLPHQEKFHKDPAKFKLYAGG